MFLQLATLAAALALGARAQNAAIDHFEKKIRPVLASHCYACHSASATAPQGGLLLDSTQGIRQGGNSGIAIQPGDPEHSLLMRAIRHTDKKLKMPPGNPLAPEVVADFELWIREGASLAGRSATIDKKQPLLWSLQKATVAGAAPPCSNQRLGPQRYRSVHPEPPGSAKISRRRPRPTSER